MCKSLDRDASERVLVVLCKVTISPENGHRIKGPYVLQEPRALGKPFEAPESVSPPTLESFHSD